MRGHKIFFSIRNKKNYLLLILNTPSYLQLCMSFDLSLFIWWARHRQAICPVHGHVLLPSTALEIQDKKVASKRILKSASFNLHLKAYSYSTYAQRAAKGLTRLHKSCMLFVYALKTLSACCLLFHDINSSNLHV